MSRNKRWRVGNFGIRSVEVPTLGEAEWGLSDSQIRSRVKKGEIGTVETLEVSSLDGAWAVRLLPGSQSESIIRSILEDGGAGDSEFLEMFLTNLLNVSSIPNGFLHQAIVLILGAYYDPSLVKGGIMSAKGRQFRRDVRRVRTAFLKWRAEYEEFIGSLPEDDEGHELIRQEAARLLGEE